MIQDRIGANRASIFGWDLAGAINTLICDAAKAILVTLLGADAEPNLSGSETEGLVRFDSNLSDRELAGILAGLLDKGVSVSQFREITTDLEDAFLSVTSRDKDAPSSNRPATSAAAGEKA